MPLDARIPLMVMPVKSELDRQQTLADIAYRNQAMDMQRQQWEAKQAEAQQIKQREQVEMTARLLDGVQDEATYQQRLAAAKQYGIDVSSAPANYDPAWVQTHHMIATTLMKPDGEAKLTTTAQELRDAGYQPGTPEFIQAMRQRLEIKDSKVVSTQAGGMASLLGYGGKVTPVILPNDGSGAAGSPATGEQRKSVGGKNYVKRGGQWFEEGGAGNGTATF